MSDYKIIQLESFFDKLRNKAKGFVAAKNGMAYYSSYDKSESYSINYQGEKKDLDDFVFSFLDIPGEIASYPLDADSVILVLGEPQHQFEECKLLESLMEKAGIKVEKDTISSIVKFPYKDEFITGKQSKLKTGLPIHDFTIWIKEKTQDFVVRKHELGQITEFITQNQNGYFVITAMPGMGKTSLVAHIVKQNDYIHHFNIRSKGINTPHKLLENLCSQLIVRYGLNYDSLPIEAKKNSSFMSQILTEISEQHLQANQKLVIVIDALDEINDNQLDSASYLPNILPENVYIIITYRKGANLKLDLQCPKQELEIIPDSSDNQIVLYEFLNQEIKKQGLPKLKSIKEITHDFFVDHMWNLSQGNFMYLRHVLHDMKLGLYDDFDISNLPKGLEEYYEQHWQYMKGLNSKDWFDYKLFVLVGLTVTKRPISIKMISSFSGKNEDQVKKVLNEWMQFLDEEKTEDNVSKYCLYHESFHDFIASKDVVIASKEVAEAEKINLKEANQRIIIALGMEDY